MDQDDLELVVMSEQDCFIPLDKHQDGNRVRCYLSVQGMTCSSCVASIEKHLLRQPGIFSVQVALLACRAEVVYDPMLQDPEKIANTLDDMGFESSVIEKNDSDKLNELYLHLGVIDEKEKARVQSVIDPLPGVKSFTFEDTKSILVGKFQVIYNPDVVGPRKIVDKIESLGLNVVPLNADVVKNASDPLRDEIAKWRATFFFILVFAVPTFVVMIYFMIYLPSQSSSGQHQQSYLITKGLSLENLIFFFLATPVQTFGAKPFYSKAIKSLRHGSTNMDVLIMLATSIAYIYSVVVLVYFMAIESPTSPMTFFDTPPMLLVFITLGRWLESKARYNTSKSLAELASMKPTEAKLVVADIPNPETIDETDEDCKKPLVIKSERIISIDLVEKGDYLMVSPGDRIPVDGKVIHGETKVDEALITGESRPVSKRPGSLLIGGSINQDGVIVMIATHIGKETTLSQIIQLIEQAQTSKAPIQQFADRVANYFVPGAVLASVLTFSVWLMIGGSMFEVIREQHPSAYTNMTRRAIIFHFAIQSAINVLTISCPCALGLATPTAVVVGTGIGAKNGLLIRGAVPLEKAAKISTIIFDKTGTITQGKPSVNEIRLLQRFASRMELKQFMALMGMTESNCKHPLAQAMLKFVRDVLAMKKSESFGHCNNFELLNGLGVCCEISLDEVQSFLMTLEFNQDGEEDIDADEDANFINNGQWSKISFASSISQPDGFEKDFFAKKEFTVSIGNAQLMDRKGVNIPETIEKEMRQMESQGQTVCIVAVNKAALALVAISDTIKPEAEMTVRALQSVYKQDVMLLTGDNEFSANLVAHQVGIKQVYAKLLPNHKLEKIKQLQKKGECVAMVGDGLNDAPALETADVGISFAVGNDVAIESADIVLVKNNLLDICAAIQLARDTVSTIHRNFFFAIVYNAVAVPIAAGVLIGLGVVLEPWHAAAAMVCSSISVVLSSLLIRTFYRKPTPHDFHKLPPITPSHPSV